MFNISAYICVDYQDNYEKFLIKKASSNGLQYVIDDKCIKIIIQINGKLSLSPDESNYEIQIAETETYIKKKFISLDSKDNIIEIYEFKHWRDDEDRPDIKQFLKLWNITQICKMTAPIMICCR